MPLTISLNGQSRSFATFSSSTTLDLLIQELGLKGDRVAVEHNGAIVPRTQWQAVALSEGDKLEVVHFVGGGSRQHT
ncbi:MAG TPA: sulfur carrier protein ThiS [Granulicella sp.]